MMSMEKLLDRLKVAKLKIPSLQYFQEYLVDIEDKSIWKYKKKDHVVNEFWASKYELWNNRLIERVFYVCQKWENKEKVSYVYEVQRYLAGSRYKINKGIYVSSFAGIRMIYWKKYDDCDWFESINERYLIDYNNLYYTNDIYHGDMNSYEKMLKKSKHKYCAFEQSGLEKDELFWYLYQFEKHPQMEMISKMGLMWILNGNMNSIKWSQKGLKIFGIEHKSELEIIKACRIFGGLKFYRKHKEQLHKYKLETQHRIQIYALLHDREFPVSTKLIDYIEKLDNIKENYSLYQTRVPDYIDYIGFCQELGIPLTSNVKYPKDFNKEHDELQEKIEIEKSREKDKDILKYVIEKLFKYRYADEQFVITPANSSQDLINESKGLNHCVRTYTQRYSKGETSIFLIRKRNDVMTPYYTLELKEKEIRQVRGNHNCRPDEEVNKFIEKWAKKFNLRLRF